MLKHAEELAGPAFLTNYTIGFSPSYFVLEEENSLKCLNNKSFQFLEEMFTCMLHCVVNNMTNTIIFQNAEMLAMQTYKHIRIPPIYKVVSYLYVMHVMHVHIHTHIIEIVFIIF